MAATMVDDIPRFGRTAVDSFGPEDFETASLRSVRSIRSAAPSYTSDAPSYHSTNPHPDPLPAYSPPARSTSTPTPGNASSSTSTSTTTQQQQRPPAQPRNGSVSSLLDPFDPPYEPGTTPRRYGLPPIPSAPPRHQTGLPTVSQFRSPSWSASATIAAGGGGGSSGLSGSLVGSAVSSGGGGSVGGGGMGANPTARLYQNVALRRARAASGAAGGGGYGGSPYGGGSLASSSLSSSTANLDGLMRRVMLERIEEEERNRVRPLEDPYLVGEEAAARARAERIARENRGDEVLIREDRRWDWFLAQTRDREERERSWKRFRRDMDRRSGSRLPFRIGARF
ncbi:hypothetical protein B0J18DRAFT_98753 [Chaetomium sp. MPI-SDFR-AT-0129]|nr:hypothetical protein B0J18DRAFT_98753 [Chaetomium sp. MPI-SDFR-AT-0129]